MARTLSDVAVSSLKRSKSRRDEKLLQSETAHL